MGAKQIDIQAQMK